jgi:hypothetical protein
MARGCTTCSALGDLLPASVGVESARVASRRINGGEDTLDHAAPFVMRGTRVANFFRLRWGARSRRGGGARPGCLLHADSRGTADRRSCGRRRRRLPGKMAARLQLPRSSIPGRYNRAADDVQDRVLYVDARRTRPRRAPCGAYGERPHEHPRYGPDSCE